MGRNVVIIAKVIGTVSLGILAGTSVNSVVAVLPAVEQATDGGAYMASSVLSLVYLRTKRLVARLSVTAFGSLTLAFFAASSTGRHPYLLYSALSLPLVSLVQAVYGPYQSKTISSSRPFNGSIGEYLVDLFARAKKYVHDQSGDGSVGADGIYLEDHTRNASTSSSFSKNLSDASSHHKRSPSSDTEIVELNDGYAQLSSDSSSSESQRATNANAAASKEFQREFALSRKVGLVSALIYSLAFGISTVGIYGDM